MSKSLKQFYTNNEALAIIHKKSSPASKIFAMVSLQERALASPMTGKNYFLVVEPLRKFCIDERRNLEARIVAGDTMSTLTRAFHNANPRPSLPAAAEQPQA